MTIKPFLKWAGGKNQLIPQLELLFPEDLKNKKTYIEPFVGGGAMFIYLIQKYNFETVIINDVNDKIINTYNIVKNNVDELISRLQQLESSFLPLSMDNRKEQYNNLKTIYNLNNSNNIEMAALFIFLNKTCFNGLYRVNRKNEFNVPMGSAKNPLICDKNNLKNVSNLLQNVIIYNQDYEDINLNNFKNNETFIYSDPPYRPLLKNISFNQYQKIPFNDNEQLRLSKWFKKCSDSNIKMMLSNSYSNDGFFENIYKYNFHYVSARRMINSIGTKRDSINEIVITNY